MQKQTDILKKILRIVALLPILSSSLVAQTDVYLKVYAKTFQRMEIDLYSFQAETANPEARATAELTTSIVSNDLWMSGYFKVNQKTGNPTASNPGSNGTAPVPGRALAWLSGNVSLSGQALVLTPHLADRASGRTIIKSDYRGTGGETRALAHRIADDIVYSLTGERGIARSKISYVHETRGGGKEIAVMDYDGLNPAILTSDKSINLSPDWSPDGSKICYTSFQDDNPNLYIKNLRTGTAYKISAENGLNSAPAWSPDGKKLALTLSKDGNAEIYLLDLGKKKLTRLTYNRAIDSSPSWSPSNRELVFTSDRSGGPQLYIMDTDGLNLRRLTYEGGYNDSPTWSPRGDRIAYVSRTASGFDIYTIDVTGENQIRLTDSSSSNEDPSWSPNGFSLIFSSTRTGAKELYSMFWDGSDQKKLTSGGGNYLPAWSPLLIN